MTDTRFRVTMMLCDHAQVASGKLFISGGGWTITPTPTLPSAVALLLHVPWGEANRKLTFALRLVDADGNVVVQPGSSGAPTPVMAQGDVEVGRPAGLIHGTALVVPLAMNFPPLLLQPNQRYVWELRINDRTEPDWHVAFQVQGTAQHPP